MGTTQPPCDRGDEDPARRTVDGEVVLELCRTLLAAGTPVRIPVYGVSMTPTLRSGDILLIEPLGDTPLQPGEVVVFEGSFRRAIAHRLVAQSTLRGKTYLVTAPDYNPQYLEAPIGIEDVLGRLAGYERDESFHTLPVIDPAPSDVWRARRMIRRYAAGRPIPEAPAKPSRLLSLARRVVLLGVNGLGRLRHFPLLRWPVYLLRPPLGDRCSVLVAPLSGSQAQGKHLSALYREHPVGRLLLLRKLAPDFSEPAWWVSELTVRTAFRRRGIGARLLREALAQVAAEGATEVFTQIPASSRSGLPLLRSLGFRPIAKPAATTQPAPEDRRGPAVEKILVLRAVVAPHHATTPPQEQG